MKANNMTLDVTAESLARKFSAILSEWLTPEQLSEVVRMNKAERNSSICHSHDFCDANQAMIDALESFNVELDIEDEAQNGLINEAWAVAKAKGFQCA